LQNLHIGELNKVKGQRGKAAPPHKDYRSSSSSDSDSGTHAGVGSHGRVA